MLNCIWLASGPAAIVATEGVATVLVALGVRVIGVVVRMLVAAV